ncbi:MAG: hypothetical protein QOE93_1445 [Actinomycetota bacterium]|nr:hypothetical protein [Actinomycetota bacterium]
MTEDPRVAIVLEHVRLENAHNFPACIAEFDHARYEVVPTGEVFDGPEAVDGFLSENRRAFPDFNFVATRVEATASAVVTEGRFTGTQNGVWRGLPATGRKVDFAMAVVFEFDGPRMVCERVYFDLGTALRQLGVAYDPNTLGGRLTAVLGHPITIVKAVVRTAIRKVTHRGA